MKSMILGDAQFPLEMQLHHKRRYEFVKQFLISSDAVLDLGCGTGYGCNLMADTAGNVTGYEINKDSVKHGKKNHVRCKFFQKDITELKEKPQFDVITMFEILEHLKKEDGEKILNIVGKKCRKMFFLSTPFDAKLNSNEYHISQWNEGELKNILSKIFDRVVFFSQDWASSLIHYPYSEHHSIIFVICMNI